MDGATVPRFSTVPSRIMIHDTEGHFFRFPWQLEYQKNIELLFSNTHASKNKKISYNFIIRITHTYLHI